MSTLEEERDFLLRSLEDLEAERSRGDIDDDDYRALHDDYTARAAAVLRRLDGADPPGPVVSSSTAGSSRSARLRWLVLGGVAVFSVAVGLVLARSSGERLDGELGSGSTRQSSAELLVEADRLTQEGDLIGALESYDEILARNPENVEALARRGGLLMQVGDERLVPDAVDYLDRALEIDPDHPVALLFRGLAHRVQGEPELALERYRALLALERDLPMPRAVISAQIDEIEAELRP